MSEKKEKLAFGLILAALLAVGGAAYWLLLGGSPAPAPAPPPPPPVEVAKPAAVDKLLVSKVVGPVRIHRAGADAGWQEVKEGDALQPDDQIETAEGGALQLQQAGGARLSVDVGDNTSLRVKDLTENLTAVRLESGLVNASVKDDPARAFEIDSGEDAVATTRGGDMAVTSNGEGTVAVGVTRGSAELQAGGKVVAIKAGQQSISLKGGAPSAPSPIPNSLLLKVAWPKELLLNRRKITVSGKTVPGAILAIAGQPVRVGADGRFTHVIYLREGQQTLGARGRDVGGHVIDLKGPAVLVDTHGAKADFDTRNLWGGHPQ